MVSNSCMASAAPGGSGGCAVEDVDCHCAKVDDWPSRRNAAAKVKDFGMITRNISGRARARRRARPRKVYRDVAFM